MGYFSRLRGDQNDDIGRLHPQAASFIVRSHFKNACSCSSDGTLTDHCHSEPSTSRLSTILRIVDSLNDPTGHRPVGSRRPSFFRRGDCRRHPPKESIGPSGESMTMTHLEFPRLSCYGCFAESTPLKSGAQHDIDDCFLYRNHF